MSLDPQSFQVPVCRSSSHPYEASLASSASSSTSSVFSVDALSQSSQLSTTDSISSGRAGQHNQLKAAPTAFTAQVNIKPACLPLRTCDAPVAPEQRQHPRRRSVSNIPPPALVRQSDRKCQFVDCLVDSATQMVEVVWPTSVPACSGEGRGILPLRTFIQETLRRSSTSFSTLQVTLYYLILIKMHVPACDFTMEQQEDAAAFRALQCGRRMFLAALILASKYLQDRNYSARAWSKISGLKVQEINLNEMAFLRAISWGLHIKEETFERWQDIILQYTPQQSSSSPACWVKWRALVWRLTPSLEGVDVRSSKGGCRPRKAQTWPFQASSPSPATPKCTTPTPLSIKALSSSSNETTPTPMSAINLPRYLEPRPDLLPPTPSRLGPLPTPSMTPQSVLSSSTASTPAASVLSAAGSRRSSMCTAMQAAQTCYAASMASRWANCPTTGRVTISAPCLPPSMTSRTSSPESMMSDATSRSSRASSISSVSSAGLPSQSCNVERVKLARLATLRCAGKTKSYRDLGLVDEPDIVDPESSSDEGILVEAMSSPDFQGLNISEVEQTPDLISIELVKPGQKSSPRKITSASPDLTLSRAISNSSATSTGGRKRGRSSGDFQNLQQHVRDILVPDVRAAPRSSFLCRQSSNATEDAIAPNSVTLNNKFSDDSLRRSVVQRGGRKRFCAEETPTRKYEGPGMWTGVL